MSTAAKPFGFPDTHADKSCHMSSKTRKLPDGRFEAVAAIYFCGKRGLTVYAIAATRARAQGAACRATMSKANYNAAMISGAVSLRQFGSAA